MNPITLVTYFYFNEGGLEKLREFQDKAHDLFVKYGLTIEKELVPLGQGHVGPEENTQERPDLIQVARAESLERFQAYMADDDVKALAPIRALGLRKMTATFGQTVDLWK